MSYLKDNSHLQESEDKYTLFKKIKDTDGFLYIDGDFWSGGVRKDNRVGNQQKKIIFTKLRWR